MAYNLEDKVAITGMGIISPLGFGLKPFELALYQGNSAVTQTAAHFPKESEIAPVAAFLEHKHFIKEIDKLEIDSALRTRFINLAARAPLTVQGSLLCALQAQLQANIPIETQSERVGIIVGGTNTTQRLSYENHLIFQHEPSHVLPRYGINFLDSSHIGYVSELLGIKGEAHVVGAASASGNMAIIQAMRLLEGHYVDYCFVLGVLADLSVVELQAFHQLGALGGASFINEPQKASRPFDEKHEGFIPAQACACLILERQNTAHERNVPILGYLLGTGISLDANHSSDPSVDGEVAAMKKALLSAQLNPNEIDYINTHGTSSKLGDEIEALAIEKLFGTTSRNFINSTKSITGHCLWSAGMVEAIATIIQLNQGFLHGNINLDIPINPNIGLIGKKAIEGNFTTALSNSFAFGGINTSIILHKAIS
jgi:malonyl-ACP decarboxylase